MKFRVIGDDLYFGVFKIATLDADLLPSVRAEIEDHLWPRTDAKPKPKPQSTKGTVL